jgi:hypothetical protein
VRVQDHATQLVGGRDANALGNASSQFVRRVEEHGVVGDAEHLLVIEAVAEGQNSVPDLAEGANHVVLATTDAEPVAVDAPLAIHPERVREQVVSAHA